MSKEPGPAADVFDMSRTVPVYGDEFEGGDEGPVKKAVGNRGRFQPQLLKKWAAPAGMLVLFSLGSLWIFMPDLFSGGSTQIAPTVSHAAQPTLSPAEAMRNAGQSAHSAEARLQDSAKPPAPPTEARRAFSEAGGESPTPEQQGAADTQQNVQMDDPPIQGRVLALEQTVTELQAKIALLEGRPIVGAPAASPGAGFGDASSRKQAQQKTLVRHPAGGTGAGRTASKPLKVALNKDFTLNTIYTGQAWIQDAEHVYVVRVGDQVGELQVLQIDTKNRLVRTTKGDIR
ncbi:hypothetical protein [Pseudomonas monteilii]|uniref:hypothetical protein n=1 Tax=Pseudomonas monteilii TaxID=76759 RepID=UPI0015FD5AEA|nr:hypothetical protein [Pseudomonas monteilii]MBA6105304.1 hypothetical protein [Pseudomonas monteilii]